MERLGGVILSLMLAGILATNIFFWHRYFASWTGREHLVDGSCLVSSTDYKPKLATQWGFPIVGPDWTSVPCKVELQVQSSTGTDVPTAETTILQFTYWQGVVFNLVDASCRHLVPLQKEKGHFACSYLTDAQGQVNKAYVGRADELPHLPKLLLMKAIGFSFWTLGPILLVLGCCLKNAIRGTADAREVGGDYKHLESAPDGTPQL
mmetsp:Transcript_88786/g.224300  ORF Transcript_88786/g.224300 Transcript_88786/m.224300 type:complete len:207 (-) Transcript_88786:79-699(-)